VCAADCRRGGGGKISGDEGSISVNFSTRTKKFNLDDNFNIYYLNTHSGEYNVIKEGIEDQPDITYKYPSDKLKSLFKNNDDWLNFLSE